MFRAEYNIEPAKKITVSIRAGKKKALFEKNKEVLIALARLERLTVAVDMEKPDDTVAFVESGVEVFVDVSRAIDTEREKARLQKEIDAVAPYVASMEKKLGNDQFVQNAPPAVVEAERRKLAEATEKLKKLQEQLAAIS
jgi:valyl-tRNA synthetase